MTNRTIIIEPDPILRKKSDPLEKVDDEIAKERLGIFQQVANEVKRKYRKGLIGSIANVLFENKTK